MRTPLKIGNKHIVLRKAKKEPNYTAKSVLTDSTWLYVEIYLRQKKEIESLFYWEQAHNFYKATQELNLVSKPLTTYYCFLNATKALLTFKNIKFNNFHGVSGHRESGRWNLQNEIISLKTAGIMPALCRYMGETISGKKIDYNLKDILYNLQYIHRALTSHIKIRLNYLYQFENLDLFMIRQEKKVGLNVSWILKILTIGCYQKL